MATTISIFLLLIVASFEVAAVPNNKPHIFLMLVDDWGWSNVGYHRNPPTKEVVTPNFDNLVKEGLELDQHYAYKSCSPSRSSLMSGRLPVHVNDQNYPPTIHNPDDKMSGFAGIPRNMTGLATKLQEAGYATHQVGKWDAGMATPDHTPKGRGFQSSFGYFHHTNDYYMETTESCMYNSTRTYPVDLWDTDKPAYGVNGSDTVNDKYEESLFHQYLMDIIANHNTNTPLFLYYAPHLVQNPQQVPAPYMSKFKFILNQDRQYNTAMVNYLDDIVGDVVAALKNRGMWDNLLFVTSSDNGGPVYTGGGANNYPLRGGKMTDWQGGIRVNAFVSGGFLPEKMRGKKTEEYIHLADWYGTFCGLAGVDIIDYRAAAANLPPVDSLDMWPLISGVTATSPRNEIHASINTLISGDYKILMGEMDQAGWTGPQYPNNTNPFGGIDATLDCGSIGCLYNIKQDPEERTNLALSMPEVTIEMKLKLAQLNRSYFNPKRGDAWPGACQTAVEKYGNYWGPFLS